MQIIIPSILQWPKRSSSVVTVCSARKKNHYSTAGTAQDTANLPRNPSFHCRQAASRWAMAWWRNLHTVIPRWFRSKHDPAQGLSSQYRARVAISEAPRQDRTALTDCGMGTYTSCLSHSHPRAGMGRDARAKLTTFFFLQRNPWGYIPPCTYVHIYTTNY